MWARLRARGRRIWQRHWRIIVGVAAAAGVVILVGWLVLYVLPPTLVPGGATDQAKAESDARTALIQAVAGLVLLAGLFFTGRTLRLNRQGQITDRFSRAIEQLGDSKLDVRLGGIYALERIARDSADDHRTIMEVLTAFVREHGAEAARQEARPATGVATLAGVPAAAPPADAEGKSEKELRTDLKAAVAVLRRRRREHEGEGDWLDLSGAHLKGAGFEGAQLDEASFDGAHLERASFRNAHLEGANFKDAHLERADFKNAHLEGANFWGADLRVANFSGAHLEGATFHGAHLEVTNFWGARLERASFLRAGLKGTLFGGSQPFMGAHLGGADFSETNAAAASSWDHATADDSTTWPDGFDPGVHGVRIP
jgi:uncharacterized protein YjbI with pentapeptide repeats